MSGGDQDAPVHDKEGERDENALEDGEIVDSTDESSTSSLSDSDIEDGGWGSPIQDFPCIAVGHTGHAELAEIANDGEESMDLFAVSWRSRVTPTSVSIF